MSNADLLVELNKKDDDLQVIENNTDKQYVIVQTDLPMFDDEEPDNMNNPLAIDSNLISNEIHGPAIDVLTRVIRVMFMINALLSCFVLTGFVPYQFLVLDETRIVSIVVFIITSIISTTFYILMGIFSEHRHALVLFVLWVFPYYTAVISFAGILRNFAPLQLGLVTALQSFSIVLYTVINPVNVDPWKSFYVMLIMGLVGWLSGIYAFIVQRDWISAIILLVASVASAAYSAIQIKHVTRYSVSEKDYIKAIIQFYADPLVYVIEKIKQ